MDLRGTWKRWALRAADGILGPEFDLRLKALSTRQNEYGYDPFGFHREDAKVAVAVSSLLYRRWFRAEAFGIERVPSGRVLLIANHSGQLPFDGVCIAMSLLLEHDPPRMARSMVERYVPTVPFFSYLFARWGQVVGTPENCLRLLRDEEAILVFPEGARGISKPFTQRYQLQEFGLGFMRLALEARAPIVPIAVIGAEEQAPALNLKPIARLVGAPSFPVMPVPPFFPIVPLPSRYRIHFGEPMLFSGDADEDDPVVERMVKQVKNAIQSMLHVGLKQRRHVYW